MRNLNKLLFFFVLTVFSAFAQTTNYTNLGQVTDYNVYVIGNSNLSGSDIQGKVAVGRNAIFANYSVADQIPNSSGSEDVLIVSDSLWYEGGRVYSGNVVYGEFADVSDNLILDGEGEVLQGNPIDFTEISLEVADISTQWKSLPANGSATLENTTLMLVGSNAGLNIFDLTAEDISSATGLTINSPAGSTVLVNISGTYVTWSGDNDLLNVNQTNVVYNFYEADTLIISDIAIKGSILAPFATLSFVSGQINGNVIVHDFFGFGQVNLSWFQGNVEYQTSEVISECYVTMRNTLQGSSFSLTQPFYGRTSFWGGTILGTATNHSTSYYCIDISHSLKWNKPYSWNDEISGPIAYITKNYYPYIPYTGSNGQLNRERKEAAAIQAAIWHFSDGFDVNTIHNSYSDIRERALQIIQQATSQNPLPIATFVVSPASQVVQVGQTAMITITMKNSLGIPLAGIEVTVESTAGIVDPSTGITDNSGQLVVAIHYDGSENAELTISTENGIISPGTRYIYPNSQTLITNQELITCLSATASVFWSDQALPGNDFDFYMYTTYNSDLPAVPINAVVADDEDIYFGTNSNGVYKFNRSDETFEFVETTNLNISALYKNGGNLFVGFQADGFAVINSENQATYYNSSNSNFAGSTITAFEMISNENILVISHDNGVTYFNLNTEEFTNYNSTNSTILPGNVYDITIDDNNGIWAATDYGLSYLSSLGATWENFTTTNSGINGDYLRAVEFGNGKIFVGTFYNGLCALEVESGVWTNYSPFISTQPVMNLFFADDKLFIANWSEGLYVFNGENFKQYSSVNQYNAPTIIESFAFDGTDTWFGTQSGLSRTINGITSSNGNAAITIGDNETYTGGSVSLDCELVPSGEIEFFSLSGSFQYNSSELTYENFTIGEVLSGCVVRMQETSPGRIEYNIYSEEPITTGGKLFDLTFTVNEELAQLGAGISTVYAMSFTAGLDNYLTHEDLGIISWSSSGTGNAGIGDATLDGGIDISDLLATVHHYTYGGTYTLEGIALLTGMLM